MFLPSGLTKKGKGIKVPWTDVFSSQSTPPVLPFRHSSLAPNAEKAFLPPGWVSRVCTSRIAATLLAPMALGRVPGDEGGPAPKAVDEW